MSELTFVRFSEYNDHEGEKWNWWLQLTGNQEEISKFAELLRKMEDKAEYDLDYNLHPQDLEPESVVDKLVEYADEGYGLSHNKVTGKFTCPEELGEDLDELYKGGINAYFKEDQA